jgi:hypothetical protein
VQRALALERRVRKHGVPVVGPHAAVAVPVSRPRGSRDQVRAHAREGGGGYERLRVRMVGGRVIYGRVGVSTALLHGRVRDGGGLFLFPLVACVGGARRGGGRGSRRGRRRRRRRRLLVGSIEISKSR